MENIILGWIVLFPLLFVLLLFRNKRPGSYLSEKKAISISVIVPFRNEYDNLKACLDSLLFENIHTNDEVIFVNDHSEDRGEEFLKNSHENIVLLELNAQESGKKSALNKGIDYAKNDWIVTLDADCRVSPGYLNTLRSAMDSSADLLLARVFPNRGNHFTWLLLEQFEYVLLSALSLFSARIKLPLLASGAALAFRKSVWNKVNKYNNHMNVKSGDDIYLLRDFFLNKASIQFIEEKEAIVLTNASVDFNSWLRQKSRWAGKREIYPDTKRKALGLFFLIQLFIPAFFILFHLNFVLLLIIVEYILIRLLLKFPELNNKYLLLLWIPMRIIYPFLVILVMFNSRKNLTWKGRAI